VTVWFATQTGTVRALAEELEASLAERGACPHVVDCKEMKEGFAFPGGVLIVMSSSFFNGSHPSAADPLARWLADNATMGKKIDQKSFEAYDEDVAKAFGRAGHGTTLIILGLGSKQYQHFCGGAVGLRNLLLSNGLTELMEPVYLDCHELQASDQLFVDWEERLFSRLGLANPTRTRRSPNISVSVVEGVATRDPCGAQHIVPVGFRWARVLEARPLTATRIDTYIRYFKLECPGMRYSAGWHCAILPCNREEAVRTVLKTGQVLVESRQGGRLEPAEWETVVQINQHAWSSSPIGNLLDFRGTYTVGQLLSQFVDLSTPLRPSVLRRLAESCTDTTEREEALSLARDPRALSQREMDAADAFQAFPSIRIHLSRLLEVLRPMAPRLYSMASAPEFLGPERFELVICDTLVGKGERQRLGLATGFLSRATPGEFVAVQAVESPFLSPSEANGVPSVEIGLGTGMAPFLGRLQRRRSTLERGGAIDPLVLFLGLRRESDCPEVMEMLKACVRDGVATIFVALSREKGESESFVDTLPPAGREQPCEYFLARGCHVTDLLRTHGEVLARILAGEGDAELAYCGKAGKVPEDVRDAVLGGMEAAGVAHDTALARWEELERRRRIIFEAW